MQLMTARARAYVYAGDWVADCTRDGCANAEFLCDLEHPGNPRSPRTRPRSIFHCSNCRQIAEIDWPPNVADIMAVLERRPIPHTRNWYPSGHDTAVRFRVPHGQSIDDLRAENQEHGVA
jgi:hypothetical protein